MEDHELMFELSHPVRLETLRILNREPQRLTDISKVLDLTSAEISRHLGRLSKAQLITKNGEGRYSLTSFGDVILSEISSFNFLTVHQQYFSTHDMSVIPDELRWLNSISKCEFVEGTLEIMSLVGDLSKNAKKYIRVISDQPMRAMVEANLQIAKTGVDIKLIYPHGADIPDEYQKKKGMPIDIKLIEDVRLSLKLNEKNAGVALPDLSGKVDYKCAMMSEDPRFLRWSNLLFEYYWEKGRSVL
jgi:predicted transcriptional regulator